MTEELYDSNRSQTVSEIDNFTLERYKQFSTYFQNGMRILDIGCNTGRGGVVIKNLFPQTKLYGIDMVKERIAKIPQGIYEEVYDKSITDWDAAALKFDRIIAGELIEHIPLDQFFLMLDKCKKLLAPNGLILFTTPNPKSLLVLLGRDSVLKDPSHVNIMSIPEFKEIIKKSGLRLKKIVGSGKSTRIIGSKIPFMPLYGSYLSILSY